MVVPEHITKELVHHMKIQGDGDSVLEGESLIAHAHRRVALCFVDICDFTIIASMMSPHGAVRFLDEFFTLLDSLLTKHKDIVKIKTIGDAYFAVAGLSAASERGSDSSPPPSLGDFVLGRVPRTVKRMRTANTTIAADDSEQRSAASVDAESIELCSEPAVVPRDATTGEPATPSSSSDLRTTSILDSPTAVDNLLALIEFCLDAQYAITTHRFRMPAATRNINLTSAADTMDVEEQRLQAVLSHVFSNDGHLNIRVRIGVHCGDVVAGVVGKRQPQYDVWGTACNMASRIESSAVNGTIQVSKTVYDILQQNGVAAQYDFKRRRVTLKGIGRVTAYTLSRRALRDHSARE